MGVVQPIYSTYSTKVILIPQTLLAAGHPSPSHPLLVIFIQTKTLSCRCICIIVVIYPLHCCNNVYHFRSSYFGRPLLRKESESQSQYKFKRIQLLVATHYFIPAEISTVSHLLCCI